MLGPSEFPDRFDTAEELHMRVDEELEHMQNQTHRLPYVHIIVAGCYRAEDIVSLMDDLLSLGWHSVYTRTNDKLYRSGMGETEFVLCTNETEEVWCRVRYGSGINGYMRYAYEPEASILWSDASGIFPYKYGRNVHECRVFSPSPTSNPMTTPHNYST